MQRVGLDSAVVAGVAAGKKNATPKPKKRAPKKPKGPELSERRPVTIKMHPEDVELLQGVATRQRLAGKKGRCMSDILAELVDKHRGELAAELD